MRIFSVFVCSLLLCSQVISASDPKAIALLKGVEQERMKCDCFHIEYTEHRVEEGKTAQQIVDFDRGKIRKEHLPNERFHGMMSLYLGDVVYVRTSYDEKDVNLVLPTSVHAYGAGIYDARMLGLADAMNQLMSIKSCLLYETRDKFSVKTSQINGKNINVVACKDGDDFWEFYIEEPGFSVLRIKLTAPTRIIEINSEYSNPSFLPFPTKVKIFRKEKDYVLFDRTITVTKVEKKKSFPAETFTLASLNLPLNTTVTDYRINRIAGYWDGEKLVDDPVRMSAQERRDWEAKRDGQPLGNIVRYVLMGAGILMIGYALYSMRQKRLKNQA